MKIHLHFILLATFSLVMATPADDYKFDASKVYDKLDPSIYRNRGVPIDFGDSVIYSVVEIDWDKFILDGFENEFEKEGLPLWITTNMYHQILFINPIDLMLEFDLPFPKNNDGKKQSDITNNPNQGLHSITASGGSE